MRRNKTFTIDIDLDAKVTAELPEDKSYSYLIEDLFRYWLTLKPQARKAMGKKP